MKTVGEMKKLRRKVKTQKFMLIILSVVCVSLFIQMKLENNKLTADNRILKQEIEEVTNELNQNRINVQVLQETVNDLDIQLKSVAQVNESYVDELNEFRTREELYDKYSYAIVNELDTRTELKYEEIKLAEELALEKGINPHLIFGTIMVESGANPNAVNSESGATGYGQFLNYVAEWVYTDLLGLSGYYPDIRKDGKTNIQMMATLYENLYENKGTTFKVVKQYSGNLTDSGAQRYLNRINHFTNKVGVVIN